jgi:hypothetical protein
MNSTFQPTPIPWIQFPVECFWYVFPIMGVLHLALFIVGSVVLLVIPSRHPGVRKRRIGRFALFITLLLIVGAFFNGLWSCLIWGRLYFSTDYVFDFSPFWPITQSVIDGDIYFGRGQLLGVSLFQLQLVWLLFAAGVWAVTILLYRIIRHRSPPNKSLQATATAPSVLTEP